MTPLPAVMGVDPGVRGGVAVLSAGGKPLFIHGFRPTQSEDLMVEAVRAATETMSRNGGFVCFMEKVGFIRGDGGKGSFTFGRVYGTIRGVLRTNGVNIHNVYPAVWMSSLGCLTGGDKKVTLEAARKLWPDAGVDLSTADSLLIAEYGRRVTTFTSNPSG